MLKIVRCGVAVLVIAMLLMGCSLAEEQEVIAYANVSAGSCLNVRVNSSLNADVYFWLERGEQVVVEGVDGAWSKVSRGGDWGWCMSKYLSDRAPDDIDGEYRVSSNGRVRVREKPDGKVVRYVDDGDIVEVSGSKEKGGNLWAFIGDGYVMMNYLLKEDE